MRYVEPAAERLHVPKAPTGIAGLDAILFGGLPKDRTTLVEGGPGSGKTVLALQTLINGAKNFSEPAIFVAFEESSQRILANASSFGWDLNTLQREKLFFLDAQPSPSLMQSGNFGLGGMLLGLEAKAKEMGAKRIVFDALDMVLDLLDDERLARREAYRLHEWLNDQNMTALITAKASPRTGGRISNELEFLQFMVDCSLILDHGLIDSTSQRSIRIGKFRGSSFEENATPLAIGAQGIEVAHGSDSRTTRPPASTERLSSGIERLDHMLGGGYYRGAGILLTGAPGTAKTTLAGAFAVACAERGDRTLFVTLDSPQDEVVRNLASVNILLDEKVRNGDVLFHTARASAASAEIHLMHIRNLVQENAVRCVIVDPISALAKAGNRLVVRGVVERLIDWAKVEGLTLLCTSLLEGDGPLTEATAVQISTLADTWINLSYVINAGERNRALSIIKSRGSNHSNQVRELVMSNGGVTLADVYTAGGEVLMGTMRWEKEHAEKLVAAERAAEARRRRELLSHDLAAIEHQLEALQRERLAKRGDIERIDLSESQLLLDQSGNTAAIRTLRGGDITAKDSRDDA